MNDLKLTESHDLDFTGGDLYLLNSEESVAKQSLKINLLFFEGEWFLDNTYGLPYMQSILVKGTPKSVIDSLVYDEAINSYNINKITSFSSSISTDRIYNVEELRAETKNGEIISITNLSI